MASYNREDLGFLPLLLPLATAGAGAYAAWKGSEAAKAEAKAAEIAARQRAADRQAEARKQKNLLIGAGVAGAALLATVALT